MIARKAELKSEKQVMEAALAEKQTALEKAEKSAKIQIAKQMLQANAQMAFIMQVTGFEEDLIKNM